MERSDLLSAFLLEVQADVTTLQRGLAALHAAHPAGPLEGPSLGDLGIVAHRIRGSAGLYGFPQLSRMAALLERLLDVRAEGSGEYLRLLDDAVGVLAGGQDTVQRGEPERDLGLEFTRVGGAERLRALLRERPEAFAPTPHTGTHPDDHELHEDAGPQVESGGSLREQFRAFHREQGDVLEYFAPEVREHLGHLRAQLDEGTPDLDVMFRAAHTIKGSAYMVGLNALGNHAHRLEDLMAAVRDGAVDLDGPVTGALQQGADHAEALLRLAEAPDTERSAFEALEHAVQATGEQLRALASGQLAQAAAPTPAAPVNTPAGPAEATSIRVPARQIEGLMDQVGELVSSRARLGLALSRLNELQSAMLDSQVRFQRAVRDFEERHLNADMLRSGPEGDPRSRAIGLNLSEQFNELELDAYDDLNIVARSVTELSADFAELRRRLSGAAQELQDEHELLGKHLRRLRTDVSQTSRVPFAQVTARLRRWAREHTDRLDFVTRGDDVKVDSATLQRLGEPLLHLLTNALHHGLGDPAERAQAGKPARGRVELRAVQEGGFLEIIVQDDGRGLNLNAIRERALSRGLKSAQELQVMPDDDVARLILLPGLSTAESLSTVAGRGVGMDVVASSTRQLGGELLIRSQAGEGTAFTLRLPISRRIMDLLQVGVGPHLLAFPVSAIRALREMHSTDLLIGDSGFDIPFEGKRVPVVDLRDLWGVPQTDDTCSLVILSTLSGDVAARVDRFGVIEESSVMPPQGLLGALEFLSGTALASTGEVLPLLEPQGLLRLVNRPDTWLSAGTEGLADVRPGRLLLVDDSLSVRRVVGRMLERGGFQVETANDGQEALEKLQLDSGFDVMISDLEMPRMNGFELLSSVRARPATAALPVIIMTTRAGEKHQRLALSLGATDYFTKPVNEALLLRRLGALRPTTPPVGDLA